MQDKILIGFISKETFERQQADIEKEKLCLIEDIFKARRMLYGFGFEIYLKDITDPGDTFNDLMDMNIPDLELELASLCATASQWARDTHFNH